MGVYIKGMEMPERCWDCDLCYDSFYCRALEVQFSNREDFEPSERRLSDCPLIKLPPHGRLIDADALYPIYADLLDGGDVKAVIPKIVIDTAPTIIEAEEEE